MFSFWPMLFSGAKNFHIFHNFIALTLPSPLQRARWVSHSSLKSLQTGRRESTKQKSLLFFFVLNTSSWQLFIFFDSYFFFPLLFIFAFRRSSAEFSTIKYSNSSRQWNRRNLHLMYTPSSFNETSTTSKTDDKFSFSSSLRTEKKNYTIR